MKHYSEWTKLVMGSWEEYHRINNKSLISTKTFLAKITKEGWPENAAFANQIQVNIQGSDQSELNKVKSNRSMIAA